MIDTTKKQQYNNNNNNDNSTDDKDDKDDNADDDLNRALADFEILLSAFPDETELCSNNNCSQQHQAEQQQATPTEFPLRVTFRLSETAWIQLEFIKGYPTSSGLQVVSYRSNSKETYRMEACVHAIKQSARECYEEQIEAALPCCLAAKDIWDNYDTTYNHTITESENGHDGPNAITTTTTSANNDDNNYLYPWITTESITEKKSIFQAHVCPVKSEHDVKCALQQLLISSTRIQRATHNMVRSLFYVFSSLEILGLLLYCCYE